MKRVMKNIVESIMKIKVNEWVIHHIYRCRINIQVLVYSNG